MLLACLCRILHHIVPARSTFCLPSRHVYLCAQRFAWFESSNNKTRRFFFQFYFFLINKKAKRTQSVDAVGRQASRRKQEILPGNIIVFFFFSFALIRASVLNPPPESCLRKWRRKNRAIKLCSDFGFFEIDTGFFTWNACVFSVLRVDRSRWYFT